MKNLKNLARPALDPCPGRRGGSVRRTPALSGRAGLGHEPDGRHEHVAARHIVDGRVVREGGAVARHARPAPRRARDPRDPGNAARLRRAAPTSTPSQHSSMPTRSRSRRRSRRSTAPPPASSSSTARTCGARTSRTSSTTQSRSRSTTPPARRRQSRT